MTDMLKRWCLGAVVAVVAVGWFAVPAGALPTSEPPAGAECTVSWANPDGGDPSYLVAGGLGTGVACTVQVTIFCSGVPGAWWVGWVQLNIPANSIDVRNTNPCSAGQSIVHIYYRFLYPFGQLCWSDLYGDGWQWNRTDGVCSSA